MQSNYLYSFCGIKEDLNQSVIFWRTIMTFILGHDFIKFELVDLEMDEYF